jgi:hypothetical protein
VRVKLVVDHIIAAPPERVMAALVDPAFLAGLGALEVTAAPEVLELTVEHGVVRQRLRYRFARDLPPVAAARVDQSKLSWVDEHCYEPAKRRATFTIEPDNYGDRFEGGGREQFIPVSEGTAWHVEVDLKVRWPVVGGLAEKTIAAGVREALAIKAGLLDAFLV